MSNTYNTQIEIRESGKLTQEYKRQRAINFTRYALRLTGLVLAFYSAEMAKAIPMQLDELSKPVRLDYFDAVYGTSLRAQYFAGKKTQAILHAKRQHGLI